MTRMNMSKTKEELIKDIKQALDTIRPSLAMHGGDAEFVDFDINSGRVTVRFQGHCVGCPLADLTLKKGIEATLMQMISEVSEVINVS